MQIKQMFRRDIDREINGVISVSDERSMHQELEEYVVTRELQRHFADFFEAYERGLDNPQRNTGVWIQGYFGSGKSHFLKMLSYLLENREVDGKRAVDYFDGKFEDPMTYAKVRRAADVTAETILFNIDELGGGYKEGNTAETAVLRSVARAFYEHLGFYGRDYKLARFEKMIDDRGKTDEFRAAYEEITGKDWLESRETYDFYGQEIAEAANRACGLSIQSITNWADSTEAVTVDFVELVSDIDEYARRREAECGGRFRLLFMVDEMGQYLNGDVSRMLNLQTLVEQFCSRCEGRVWMVVTSQEAIDEMTNVVSMDFSKIQGRFTTRLSLSSSSVDEVIKKRVLDKTDEAEGLLKAEYAAKSAVLKNLFAFEDSRGDLRGYSGDEEFTESFPFVGYQFTLMPDVLKEIRKHGYQGKSLSTGERSMLACYQEAAKAVEGGSEGSLVPFWRVYDTLEKELDHGIKQVFERARKASAESFSLQPQDIEVLKVLYLINYISDIKPTVGNIAILLVDRIDVDKVTLRESVKDSLDRLVRENYVSRNGERYSFLTDEEQDVAREIREVQVDPSSVIEEIKKIIFDAIYKDRKYRKGANDFPFDRYVDGTIYGQGQNGMRLNLITLANPELADAPDAVLDMKSIEQALLVLDTASDYWEVLYNAACIQKYVRTQNVQALTARKRAIIQAKQDEANTNRKEAVALIEEAIVKGRVSVNGRTVQIPAANARQKIDGALDELVGCTFTKAGLVDRPLENDGQLRDILAGSPQQANINGEAPNTGAVKAVADYLESRARTHQPTTMGDVQRHFKARPFGWREIDVAAAVAQLIEGQQATLTYGGAQISPRERKMVDYLRKATEVDKATVKKRTAMPAAITSRAKSILRELDGSMQIPGDEDGLIGAVEECLEDRREHYEGMLRSSYSRDRKYPGRGNVDEAIRLSRTVLGQRADNEAFLREFCKSGDAILDNAEDLEAVENFFRTNQKDIFDDALKTVSLMDEESVYVEGDAGVKEALVGLEEILALEKPYDRIHELPGLAKSATEEYGRLVAAKHEEMSRKLQSALNEIEAYAEGEGDIVQVGSIVQSAKESALAKHDQIHSAQTCTKLDSINSQIDAWRSSQLSQIDAAVAAARAPKTPATGGEGAGVEPVTPPKHKTKVVSRSSALPSKVLRTEGDVDAYVEQLRARLLAELDDETADGIRLG